MPRPAQRRRRLTHDQRAFLLAWMAGFPGSLVALLMLWLGDYTAKVQWTLSVLIVATWWGFAMALKERVAFPLQTISNLLAALREGDYSIRARGAGADDPLSGVMTEVNALGSTLQSQRLGALEATALLSKVMGEIDVAVFTFDGEQRLRLVNHAAERLLAQPSERLLGRTAETLGLADCLAVEASATLQKAFPSRVGRWGIRHTSFRQGGRPHHLLVIADLSRALREEERQAWQRLIRVLGHELNNSLAPIQSVAGSLKSLLARSGDSSSDWREDMQRGLAVIGSRAEALGRFTRAYGRLARLPEPRLAPVDVDAWVRRVVALETRMKVQLDPGPALRIQADGDQLDQLLINLVRNAVDASLETNGTVRVTWQKNGVNLNVIVDDEGPGLSNTANLFVPFFTTKPAGSGIGLVLSRQIAEAHGGALLLENRRDRRGCEARLQLPL